MSKFYGQVEGQASTVATRRGGRDIKVSAQSWDGSLQTRLYYEDDKLMVDLSFCEGSGVYGDRLYRGPFTEFVKKLGGRIDG